MPMWRTSSRTASRCASHSPGNEPTRSDCPATKVWFRTPDRALGEQVVGDDGPQEAVLVTARFERAVDVVKRRVERGGGGIEVRVRERLHCLDPPSTLKTSE